jgi:soluble lytic murein transglycosylase
MRRRTLGTIAAVAVTAMLVGLVAVEVHHASHVALPLSDAAIIREQAAAKRLDPALIAAVIYAESKFEPRPSSAGAQGLMQILPATAYYLAHLYGSYYLRYLLDHYGGDEMLAVAAYNGGLANVDRWVAEARSAGHELTPEAIPFPETREYVQRVLDAQRAYRATYPEELGLR